MGVSSKDFEYVVHNGGLRIERCLTRSQSLVMPEFIEDMVVTAIAPYAFEGSTHIRDVICPPQVTEIGSRAFANCPSLKRIVFPKMLDRYDNSWVAGCSCLEEIVLPGAVVNLDLVAPAPLGVKRICIGEMTRTVQIARAWKVRLEHVDVHPDNRWLSSDGACIYNADGAELIVHATKGSKVTVASGCRWIAARAFEIEKHLEHVDFPEGMCEIGERAFAESTLRGFESPHSLRIIRREAFAGCQSLEEVRLSDGLREIEERAFAGCSSCSSMCIPSSVVRVERKAFEETNLQPCGEHPTLIVSDANQALFIDESGALCERGDDGVVVLEALDQKTERYRTPAGTVRVADRAFFEHPCLEQLEIAEGVLNIGQESYMGCRRLRSVTLPSTLRCLGARAFATTALTSCVLPASVKTLGECAFAFNFKNWHPTTNPPESRSHITLEPGNERYFVEGGLLYEECEGQGTKVVLYVGPEIDLEVAQDARSIAPYAFFGVQGIRELRLPASIPTGEATFAMRKPPERIVLLGDGGIEFETMHDWRGVCALQRSFASDGTTNARLLCATFDEEALSAQADYEAYRYMITRLLHPEFLEPAVRESFESTLREHLDDACVTFARHDDRARIDGLVDLGVICAENIDKAIDAVSNADSAPTTARLLELKRTRFSSSAHDYGL
ncbi:MAG: leucine-rich repeat domain-containing protein [Eggerthellaceae bacterium]|nr:leucine-rich repeat domain-containing protein [Eggerthellaceae bacterium]